MSHYYTNYPSSFLLYLGIRATLIPCQVLPLLLLPLVLCDNLGATYFSVNPIRHSCSKHVEIDIHYVRDYVTNGVLDVQFISTEDELVDILTKPLSSSRFSMLKIKLSVLPNPIRLRGVLVISMHGARPTLREEAAFSGACQHPCMTRLHLAGHVLH